MTTEKTGRKYAVALSAGTAALHLAIKLCGEKLYSQPQIGHGTLEGCKVFASDMTFNAAINPIAYEGGEAVFIDAVGANIFRNGLCLPSDNKMTMEQVDKIIEIIHRCFR